MSDLIDYLGVRQCNYAKFFCMNCTKPVTVFLNEKGHGKIFCPDCGAEINVKRCRDSFHFKVFEPKYDGSYYQAEIHQQLGA